MKNIECHISGRGLNCSSQPSDVDFLVQNSFLMRSYYNSILFLHANLPKLERKFPHLEFHQIPGSEYQKVALESNFEGFGSKPIYLDREADQIVPQVFG